jgi:hypothetical protein
MGESIFVYLEYCYALFIAATMTYKRITTRITDINSKNAGKVIIIVMIIKTKTGNTNIPAITFPILPPPIISVYKENRYKEHD